MFSSNGEWTELQAEIRARRRIEDIPFKMYIEKDGGKPVLSISYPITLKIPFLFLLYLCCLKQV